MSSSFHFAGDFIKNEIQEDESVYYEQKEEDPDHAGLKELANIIENIIGKASLKIEKIAVHLCKESGIELLLLIDQVDLIDHIKNKSDIPTEILESSNDIFNYITKFLTISNFKIKYRSDLDFSESCLLIIPKTWIKFVFVQKVPNQSEEFFVDSVQLSDLKIDTLSYGGISIFKLQDLDLVLDIFKKNKKSNSEISLNKKESKIKKSLLLNSTIKSYTLILLPHSQTEFSENDYESYFESKDHSKIFTQQHLKFNAENAIIGNNQIGNFFFETKQISLCEYIEKDKSKEFCLIKGYTPVLKIWVDYFNYIQIDDQPSMKLLVNLVPDEHQIVISVPPLYLQLSESIIEYLESYFPKKESSNMEKTNNLGPKSKYSISLHTSIIRLKSNFVNNQEYLGFDIHSMHLDFEKQELASILNQIDFYFISADTRDYEKIISIKNLSLNFKNTNLNEGITESYFNFKKDKFKESPSENDQNSSKSWSEFEGDSDSNGNSGNSIKISKQAIDLKYQNFDLDEKCIQNSNLKINLGIDLLSFNLNLIKIQRLLNLVDSFPKSKPDFYPFSLFLTVSVSKLKAILELENKIFYDLELLKNNTMLAINCIESKRNLMMADFKIENMNLTQNNSNSKDFKIMNQISINKPVLSLLWTQIEDFETNIRNSFLGSKFGNFVLNIPEEIPNLPDISINKNKKEDPFQNLFKNLLTIDLEFQDVFVFVTRQSKYLIFSSDFTIESDSLSNPLDKQVIIKTSNLTMYFGIDDSIPSFFQSKIKTDKQSLKSQIVRLRCVPVVNLDSSKIYLKLKENKKSIKITFNQITFEFCKDSKDGILELFKDLNSKKNPSFANESPTSLDFGNVNTFDSVDPKAFENQNSTLVSDNQSEFEIELEEEDNEKGWHMDFESTQIKEGPVDDMITIFPSSSEFILDLDFLKTLGFEDNEETSLEEPELNIQIDYGNISVKLYPGYDFLEDPEEFETVYSRDPHQLELYLSKIKFKFNIYSESDIKTKEIYLNIRDIDVFDKVPQSRFKKLFSFQEPDLLSPPRVTNSDMLSVNLIGNRVESLKEEFKLKFSVLSIQLSIDQDTIIFLESFFGRIKSDNADTPSYISTPSFKDQTFFQYCEILPMSISVDYKPKHVDYTLIKQGEFLELLNFIHLDGAKLYLHGVKLTGIEGWHRLLRRLVSIWIPHVKSNQIPQLVSGVMGIKTIVNIGTGIADLVVLPIEQFQKDGRVVYGITRGTKSFLKATTKETVNIGSKIASGTHRILERAERKGSRSSTERVPQTVPARMIKPLIKATGLFAESLVQLSQSLENGRSGTSKFK